MSDAGMMEERIQRLIDEEEIRQLMFRFAECIDCKLWPEWESLFTEDVAFVQPFGRYDGRAGLGEWAGSALAPFEITHHVITNQQIQISGDTATSRQNVTAVHTPSKKNNSAHFDEGGHYELLLVRTSDGWKIRSLEAIAHWSTGPDETGLGG